MSEILVARKFAPKRHRVFAMEPGESVAQLINVRDFPKSVAGGRREEARDSQARKLREHYTWKNAAVIGQLIAPLTGYLRLIPIDADAEFVHQEREQGMR